MWWIVNVGFVGELCYGSIKVIYVIYYDNIGEVMIWEVDYDVVKICWVIVDVGLLEVFVWRFSYGFEYVEWVEDVSYVCECWMYN